MINWLLLAAMGLGHGCLAVLAVNILHGIGVPEGTPTRVVKVSCISFLAFVSIGMTVLVVSDSWPEWPIVAQAYAALCIATATLGLPLVTIARALRSLPEGITGRSRTVDLRETNPRSDSIGPAWDSFWLRIPYNDAFRLELTDWQVERAGLPRALDGLRILQLTDLHLTPAYADRFFEAMLEQAEGFDADLVVFTGDLIDDPTMLDRVVPLLSRFQGRVGKFAVLGNHDYRTNPEGAMDALRSAGFEVVEGRWTSVDVDGVRLAIGGTSAPWGPMPDPSKTPEADVRLLLSHSPDSLPWAARQGVDLMLSGHTHGGQYRLPVFGPVILPSRYSRRYDKGFFRKGPTLLYVSLGIAAQHPIRVRCPAEISRFTLRAPVPPASMVAPHQTREPIAAQG